MRLYSDLKQYSNGSFLKLLSTVFLNPNFHAIILHRISYFLYKTKILTFISKIITYINRVLFSVDIDYRADLSGGLQIIHGIGIVIGKDVKSEGRLRIYQGVTIGGNNKSRIIDGYKRTQPIIMDNVTLFPNSSLFGPIVISENVIIGANTSVFVDIKKDTKVYVKSEIVCVSNE